MDGERFSDVMKAFHSEVLNLDTTTKQAILTVLRAASKPLRGEFRKLADNTVVPHMETHLDGLLAVVPTFLRPDAQALERSLAREVKLRGETWAREAAHLAVAAFMTDPLAAHLTPKPATGMTTKDVADIATTTVKLALPNALAAHFAANPPAPAQA